MKRFQKEAEIDLDKEFDCGRLTTIYKLRYNYKVWGVYIEEVDMCRVIHNMLRKGIVSK